VTGSAPRWFIRSKTVTHPGTNRPWRRVIALTETKLSQTGNVKCDDDAFIIRLLLVAGDTKFAVCVSVCSGRISSETAERIWLKFYTETPDTESRILVAIAPGGPARGDENVVFKRLTLL